MDSSLISFVLLLSLARLWFFYSDFTQRNLRPKLRNWSSNSVGSVNSFIYHMFQTDG